MNPDPRVLEATQRPMLGHLDPGMDEILLEVVELLRRAWRAPGQLTAVRVPEGVDRAQVQSRLRLEHGIEVGGGLGPDAPSIWRIGLTGPNATEETAERVLGAFEMTLAEGAMPLAA
jgi:aspartate aminotransferase-like enzyme